MTDEYPCYIGRKPCGCIVFACVDSPEHIKDTSQDVARAIRNGLAIERVTVQYVRDNMRRCKCPPAPSA